MLLNVQMKFCEFLEGIGRIVFKISAANIRDMAEEMHADVMCHGGTSEHEGKIYVKTWEIV